MNVTEIKKSVSTARRLFAVADQKGREARIAGARATHAVYAAGLIGAKRTEKYGWDRADDYAATLGTKKSNLAGLRSIGVALSVGFEPDGADAARWGVLSSKAATADVTAVTTKSEAPSLAEIRKVLDTLATASPAPAKKGADKKSVEKGDEKGEPGVPVGRNNTVKMDSIETIMAGLRDLTPAEAKRLDGIAESLAEIVAAAHKRHAASKRPARTRKNRAA